MGIDFYWGGILGVYGAKSLTKALAESLAICKGRSNVTLFTILKTLLDYYFPFNWLHSHTPTPMKSICGPGRTTTKMYFLDLASNQAQPKILSANVALVCNP